MYACTMLAFCLVFAKILDIVKLHIVKTNNYDDIANDIYRTHPSHSPYRLTSVCSVVICVFVCTASRLMVFCRFSQSHGDDDPCVYFSVFSVPAVTLSGSPALPPCLDFPFPESRSMLFPNRQYVPASVHSGFHAQI